MVLEQEQKLQHKEQEEKDANVPFIWEAANLYFLMIDRFNNGDKSNDCLLYTSPSPRDA